MTFAYPDRRNGEGYRWLVLCRPDGSLIAWSNLPNHEPHARALVEATLGDSSLPGIAYVNHEKPTPQEYRWQPVALPKPSRHHNLKPFPPEEELMKRPVLKKSTPVSKKSSTTARSRKTKPQG